MTNEQAKKMLKAKLECLKRETSGTDIDCNCRNCDECSLNYGQGNMAEQKEALDMAIQALEQRTHDNTIGRDDIKKLKKYRFSYDTNTTIPKSALFVRLDDINALPFKSNEWVEEDGECIENE